MLDIKTKTNEITEILE